MKKYTKEKQAELKFPFILSNNIGAQVETYIFDTMYNCYAFFVILGLALERKAATDISTSSNANIFADKVFDNRNDLNRIFRQIVLADDTFGTDIDVKIKILFDEGSITPEQKKIGKELMDSYARGGAEYFEEKFSQVHSFEDVVRTMLTMFQEIQIA